ncbi:3-methyl-2-oxobutanoate dehydrogenase subunit beta [candidate division WOR-3 bacterium]|uniref:3-methyl-2-oxobutanoate dehydrogenase subunit beta n=1 Tax=candidate division WOR-3 bacterium TaxID=2052148 RepID=A0A660SLN6_UNCW3|nr:MAG: 3-methyl-2-oxobutanoate dehydrogenase subunit beta [candidate division WOR-3 bacterium]
MSERYLFRGNHAIAEGAMRAGCRFFAGYPITPQNEIPEYFSARMPDYGGVFLQTESEIAAINMLFGASAAGVRAMTTSSSPGISLMQEGISYSCGADLPMVIANVVRGGPGLGNIAPAQSDYFQATRGGGHGDYRTPVLAPNSVQEMFEFPKLAFELAERYRTPVIILADGLLGQMIEPLEYTFDPVDPKTLPKKDYILDGCKGRERRVIRSYDLRPGYLEKLNFERIKKYQKIEAEEVRYETDHLDDAEFVIIAYGTCSRVAKAAVRLARNNGVKMGLLRPITLWPFPKKMIEELTGKTRLFIVVEMSMGQMIEDVELVVKGKAPVRLIPHPGGGIPTAREIWERFQQFREEL